MEIKGEHFLVVNGNKKPWDRDEISYKEVIELAYGAYPEDDKNIIFTIIYSAGPAGFNEGSLTKGNTVKVKGEMSFNVGKTDKS